VVGNVWEWVQDSYQPSYEEAPRDGSAWEVVGASNRVYRGGGWRGGASDGRSANRSGNSPAGRSYSLGLRPAITVVQ